MSETSAKIVADTFSPKGTRITTFEVTAPRYLLAEINTHRIISRSAASSRAIPVSKRIEMAKNSPFVPGVFGQNKPGMQSDAPIDTESNNQAREIWLKARDAAVDAATQLAELDVHKQQANRLLEPFVYYSGVMTATEWDNFFDLRMSDQADPEFELLARKMYEAYQASNPILYVHHLPYMSHRLNLVINDPSLLTDFRYISAARCARVSYKTHTGKPSTLEEDIALCRKLLEEKHMSPFDHVAIADTCVCRKRKYYWAEPERHRQYYGWIPYRDELEKTLKMRGRRDSFAPLF